MAPSSRVLCAGVLALAALVAFTVQAGDAPAPAPISTDPIGEAIEKIKTSTASTKPVLNDLEEPRTYLVKNWEQSLPRVLVLLDDSDIQIRINAAIILAQVEQAGNSSPKLLEGLKRCCFNDSVSAVNYWGFVGLMADNVPADAKREALRRTINMDRPRPLRLAAIPTLMEKKPKAAIPIIIAHLQNILKDYKAQVETKVTSEPATGVPGAAPTTMRPGPRSYPTGRDLTPEERDRINDERDRDRQARDREGMGMMVMGGAPLSTAARQLIYREDLAKLTADQVKDWVTIVESLTAVKEVHLMGWTLEDLIKTHSPEEKLFGFGETAPWDLGQCVEKAVLWLKAHQADYEPAASKPAPTVPAPAPAAAPTPATPAAAPKPSTTFLDSEAVWMLDDFRKDTLGWTNVPASWNLNPVNPALDRTGDSRRLLITMLGGSKEKTAIVRPVALDLRLRRAISMDVINDTGEPIRMAIGVGTGPKDEYYEGRSLPLETGANNGVQFTLQASDFKSAKTVPPWTHSVRIGEPEAVQKLYILIYNNGKSGKIYVENITALTGP